ncbi:putative pectinesterase/pectinesterase inhibitor 41 [Morus notabilis]|uniref:Pectinesterase n=2 Tax=Morus notabilis TaxID=981085 RepID=W9QFI1_9ROSA|nr:probable pectinesterase/pectinesterase inhibitor 41 [Morus notabilis]EXB33524.1 putative pectinesterase/pectinesterase inhibitor 41 [Morus notabilis]
MKALKLVMTILAASFFIFFSFSSPSLAADNTSPTTPVSPKNLCKNIPDPTYCKNVLQPYNQTGNVYYYGRASVKKSVSQARKFKSLIEKYLRNRDKLSVPAVRALEDCRQLAGLNLDFLLSSFETVNKTSRVLSTLKAEDVQTLLSAILTNQQTCLDGIQATASSWSVKNGISAPLKNDTKLYSVSLALFTKGWVPKKKKATTWSPGGKQLGTTNRRLPLRMSGQNRAVYEAVSRRKLLQAEDENDEVVSVNDIVTVCQDGSGNFTTINDAVSAAPNNSLASNGYFLIYVTAGVYEEYVSIAKNKRYLMMIGDGINQTIITGNRSVVDGWTTYNSATFAVVAPGFVAVNITFRNTAGAIKHQAVALRNGADLSTFYSCSFEAYQDTLYTHSLRQFYRDCDIYGTVDFIFGNAAVVFQNCNMYPRLPMQNQFNAITAQGRTDPNQNTGISIHNCTIKAADDLAASNGTIKTYLGRPWKEYSTTVYMQSYIDSVVDPAGWREWNGDFALNTSYYAEYNNTGPGSDTTNRVRWPGYHVIGNSSDVGNFTVFNFLLGDDWLPQTGVPFNSGLLS